MDESPDSTPELQPENDDAAAREVYRRFAARLCRLAAARLGNALRRRVDAEDVLQSVLRTFFRRVAEGEYKINDYGSLWSLLAQITINKVRRYGRYHRTQKRDISKEVYPDDESAPPESFDRDPSPQEVAMLQDEVETLLASLNDRDATIVRLWLAGCSVSEIASDLETTLSTIRRDLERIKDRLKRQADHESDED